MKLLVLPFLFLFSVAAHTLAPLASETNDFHGIDFGNLSYPYRFPWGKRVRLPLKSGHYEYDFRTERGWFDLSDVYVADVTGDKRPEVIVMLSHVACGVSCDGGSTLFYIYSFDNHRLKPQWQYETGDLAYGCGLKSFSAKRGTLIVELFGRCSQHNRTASSTGKFQIRNITRLTFKSNGARFVVGKRQFFSVPERNLLNYVPQISVTP